MGQVFIQNLRLACQSGWIEAPNAEIRRPGVGTVKWSWMSSFSKPYPCQEEHDQDVPLGKTGFTSGFGVKRKIWETHSHGQNCEKQQN
jgi:hypothetical protein